MVLLKNDGGTLPLNPAKSVVVIGPLGDDQHDMLGPWWGKGEDGDAVSVYAGIKAQNPNTTFAQGCTILDKDPPDNTPAGECGSDAGFAAAVAAANGADQVVLALGESRGQSGEAAARSEIDLPGKQQELIDAIKATGKPFVVVLFNGRPLTLTNVDAAAPAILEAWFPGVEAGNAVADVLFGKVNPGGKLPVSFPRSLGQIPIYYNHEPTGRPCDTTSKYNSRYRDLASCDPLYAFGFGLSYTTFSVTNLHLNTHSVAKNGRVTASMDVTNTGAVKGDDVAQLYIHDPVASISQPVRRLRGFQRVTLAPGEKQTVSFTLDKSDFGFYDNRGKFVVEPGDIDVFAGRQLEGRSDAVVHGERLTSSGECARGCRASDLDARRPRRHARVLTSTPATTHGTVPLLAQSCGVPCWMTESPGRSVISRPSKISVSSPEMTAMRSIVSVAWASRKSGPSSGGAASDSDCGWNVTMRNARPPSGGCRSHVPVEVSVRVFGSGGVPSVTHSSVVTIGPKSITVGGSPSNRMVGLSLSSQPVTTRFIVLLPFARMDGTLCPHLERGQA